MNKILVCGGRNYNNRQKVYNVLDNICMTRNWWVGDLDGNWLPNHVKIINGGQSSADKLSSDWAIINWTYLKEYPADWQLYGRKAGPIRNEQMLLEAPDLVVAFPGGKGTADMVRRAKKVGIEVIEISE